MQIEDFPQLLNIHNAPFSLRKLHYVNSSEYMRGFMMEDLKRLDFTLPFLIMLHKIVGLSLGFTLLSIILTIHRLLSRLLSPYNVKKL